MGEDALITDRGKQTFKPARALYGREPELLRARAALADARVRVIVVAGPSGVGKSALARQLLDAAAREGAITGACTHVEGQAAADVSPLMQALEQAVTRGLDQLYEPEAGLATLASALGPLAGVIGPAGDGVLRHLDRGAVTSASGAAAAERFYQAVLALLQWLSGFGQPVVLLLDDWGRAGERAAEIYGRLLADSRLPQLTLLATERDGEPFALEEERGVVRLELAPLDEVAAIALAKDLLGGADDASATKALRLAGESRAPLDIIYAIRVLQSGAGLRSDGASLTYEAAAAAGLVGEPAVDVAVSQALGVHRDAGAVLRAMAVYGDAIVLADLVRVIEGASDVTGALQELQRSGLVNDRDGALALSHDKIRDNVLARDAPGAVRKTAARIAEALRHHRLQSASGAARTDVMLRRRLEAGLDGVDAAAWAALFVEGAEAKRRVGALDASVAYAEAALTLADAAGSASHEVWREGVYAALARKEHELALTRAEKMLADAQTAQGLAEAREFCVVAARMADNVDHAISIARDGLRAVGLRAPERASWFDVIAAAARVVTARPERNMSEDTLSDAELALLAPMLRAMNAIAPVLFERDLRLAMAFGAGAIAPRVARGTAAGASIYAFVCSMLGLHRRAATWASLSDALQGPGQPLQSTAMQFATGFGHWYVRSRAEMRDRAETVLALAYAEGDLSLVAQANRDRVYDALLSEKPLVEVLALADQALDVARRFDDRTNAVVLRALRQLMVGMIAGGETPWVLSGADFGAEQRAEIEKANFRDVRRTVATLEQTLSVVFGAYDVAAARARRWQGEFDRARSLTQHRTWTFLSGLAAYRSGASPDWVGVRLLRRSARLNGRDNMHRVLLLDAERARVGGRRQAAARLYGAAVEWAGRSGCALEYAIVTAAAAEGAALIEDRAAAARYGAEAIVVWRQLGARAVLGSRHGVVDAVEAPEIETAALGERDAELALGRALAERANAAKSRFIAAVGHELATPLQGLQGLLDEAQPDVQAMRGAVVQLTALVRDLTDLGAMDGGALVLTSAPFELRALAEEVAAQLAPIVSAHERVLRVVAPMAMGAVLGDAVRVKQVLSNLVVNAVKHGAGDIEVRIDAEDTGGQRRVCFTVRDHGVGLTPADLALIFEPFRRGASRGEGHGLGLSIARRLAVAMGGDLTAELEAESTVFRLTLNQDAASVVESPFARRVLLVEDDLLTRRTLRHMLEQEGCAVDEARDGAEALAQMQAGAHDLVLLDVGLPKLSGLDVLEQMRVRGIARRVALMSAAPIDADADVVAKLRKPVGRGDLVCLLGAPAQSVSATAGVDAEAAARHIEDAVRDIVVAHEAGAARGVAMAAHRLAGLASLVALCELSEAALRLEDAALADLDLAPGVAAVRGAAEAAFA